VIEKGAVRMEKLADMFRGTGVERMARSLDNMAEQIAGAIEKAQSGDMEPTIAEPFGDGLPVKHIYLTQEDLDRLTFVKTNKPA
jgi:hypothetical protein